MKTLIVSFIQYYGAKAREVVVTDSTGNHSVEARLLDLDLAGHDASTFPYLP